MTITLYHGDCLEYMRTMPDKSVDFCWADPPYNVGKDYGDYKDSLSDDDFIVWSSKWIYEAKRITGNKIAVLAPTKYISEFWQLLGPDYRQIILSYSPEGAFRYGFVNQFSSILTNVNPVERTKNVWHNMQMPGLGYFFRENNYNHPGYTSEDITKKVIRKFTLLGQSVIDPFLGTGTTGKVCVNLGRNFIGCEQEKRWYNLAQKRIAEAQLQPMLFNHEPQPKQAELEEQP